MLMVILIASLSVIAVASTIVALRQDGYRRTPTDWSRLPDRADSSASDTTLERQTARLSQFPQPQRVL